jgi:hypothetical protein
MTTRLLLTVFCACLLVQTARSQDTLADLVGQAKAEWMFAKWEAKGDQGESVTLNVTWDLDKFVAVLHGKMGTLEFKGYTTIDPSSRDIKYISFSNRESISKGRWEMEGDELVLRLEEQDKQGTTRKTAAVFTGSASEGLQVRIHKIEDSGKLATPARVVYKFKKSS